MFMYVVQLWLPASVFVSFVSFVSVRRV